MQVGFDAKRAFFNASGLGNYSRNLIGALEKYYPSNRYLLYTPRHYPPHLFSPGHASSTITPERPFGKMFPSLWRQFMLSRELPGDQLDLFHGLSAELPVGIEKTGIPSLVTVHDLIFIRYPHLYPLIDRTIYRKKTLSACNQATRILAISKQTKDDIVHFFHVDPQKIEIVYQSCHNRYFEVTDDQVRQNIRKKYGLPSSYMLYVGTIEKRKNLLGLIKAMEIARPEIPLVVVGKPQSYAKEVKKYIQHHNTGNVIFPERIYVEDLPVLYQMSALFVYPSFFEGFGIPIIEALASGVPVITSRGGCFAEAGGPSSYYTDPSSPESIAEAIQHILSDTPLRNQMITEGKKYVSRFTPQHVAKQIMGIYEKTIIEHSGPSNPGND